jgi:hypothetical protein
MSSGISSSPFIIIIIIIIISVSISSDSASLSQTSWVLHLIYHSLLCALLIYSRVTRLYWFLLRVAQAIRLFNACLPGTCFIPISHIYELGIIDLRGLSIALSKSLTILPSEKMTYQPRKLTRNPGAALQRLKDDSAAKSLFAKDGKP